MSRKSVVVTTGIPDGGAMNGDNDVVAPSAGGADAAVPAVEGGRGSVRESSARFAGKYAVILVLFLIIVIFSAIKPSTFFTVSNAQAILTNQAALVILSLGLTIPLAAGEFDLSVASVVGFSASLVAYLTSVQHWKTAIAIPVVLLLAAAIGAVNALFVVKFNVNSFITTLGSGTLVTGVAVGVAGPTTIGNLPRSITSAGDTSVGGIQILVYLSLAVTILLWFVLEYTVWGRHLLFTGMAKEAARLAGVPVARIRTSSLILSATLAGVAGLVLVAQVGAADPTYGAPFLLPAFAAAFLGATTIKRGRYNAWGTLVGVYLLATGTTGLLMLGASNWVSNVFNGGALMLAVALAVLAARHADR